MSGVGTSVSVVGAGVMTGTFVGDTVGDGVGLNVGKTIYTKQRKIEFEWGETNRESVNLYRPYNIPI